MPNMQIIEVTDKRTQKEFLQLPVRLYKNEQNWIRPLDKDIEKVFDPTKNKYFEHGECTRWILVNDQKETIGRVAAFIDRKTAYTFDQPTGGMGFFECINDQKAAFLLFDTCKEWLEARNMEAMDGPINFGDRMNWWGLLVDGFYEPNYGMFYHFPYYQQLFEAYGFNVYFKQFTYYRKLRENFLDERLVRAAERTFQNPDFHFEHCRKDNLEKYGEDFRTIYNKAWAKHDGVEEMTPAQIKATMSDLKPVLEEDLLWFAYYKGEPVAFFLMLPELNQIFKHVNGKLDLIGKLKFVYHRWKGTCKKMFGVVFGVVPEFQSKGAAVAIIIKFYEICWAEDFRYDELEMNWIGDFNPKMMKVAESVGGSIRKTHVTYRKLFDETKPFKRAPIIH